MVVLSFGFQNPQNGDPGSIYFPALNFDIEQLNDHTHDGVNSALISGPSIAPTIFTAASANWTGTPGNYAQQIILPLGFNLQESVMVVFDASGNVVANNIDNVGGTEFTIYSPDNTFVYTVVVK